MSFSPGARLGPYEIVAPLGAGGMGEVYRAKDTRLDRTVAVKVLLAGSAWSADARARFEREARAISQLNHPHICALFDVGRAGDTEYIVLEHLDGETLASRLVRGAVPVPEAIVIAIQIADALDAAHRSGIIHRDLKPGNIMLVRAGAKSDAPAAKLLDFGLAKAVAAPTTTSGSNLATVTSPMPLTGQGTVLGTVLYMAPEQVEGSEADARSDLWAFGCVLFEMLTGRRTFDGKTQTNVAAAILEREAPAVTTLAPHVPSGLAHIVGRCLEKDPDARWQTASDVKRELQWAARHAESPTASASDAAGQVAATTRGWWRDRRSLAALGIAALALAAAAWSFIAPAPASARPDVVSLSITLPDSMAGVDPPNNIWQNNIAISPDDAWISFSGLRGESPALFLRRLETFELREVPGGGRHPFFSADGRALAFLRDSEVWRTPIDRLAPVRVGVLPAAEWNIWATLWHPGGYILFATERGLYRLADAGGDVSLVVKSDPSSRQFFRELSLLSDGRILASTTDTAGDHLLVVDPATWQTATVDGQAGGRFAAGWLFRAGPAGFVASRFDERRLVAEGEPIALNGAAGTEINMLGVPAVSRNGSVAWFVVAIVARSPVFVDRSGRESALPFVPSAPVVRWPRLSPSGLRLAFGFMQFNEQVPLQILDLKTGALTRLSRLGATEPVWFPDESAVATSAGTYPNHGLVRQPFDGRNHEALGEQTDFEVWPTSVSKNGELAYYVGTREDIEDLYVLDLKTRKTTRIPNPGTQRGARFSPDGRWIAYESASGGISQVEVVSWPDLAVRRVVSSDGGTEPIWSADQSELLYRNGDKVMAAKVLPGPDFSTAPAAELFSRPFVRDPFGDQSWDLAPDKRFLMLKAKEDVGVEVRMIRNATALLSAAAGGR